MAQFKDSRLALFLGFHHIHSFSLLPPCYIKLPIQCKGLPCVIHVPDFRDPLMWHFLNHIKLHHWAPLVVAVFWDFSWVYEMFNSSYMKHWFVSVWVVPGTDWVCYKLLFVISLYYTLVLFSVHKIKNCMYILFSVPLSFPPSSFTMYCKLVFLMVWTTHVWLLSQTNLIAFAKWNNLLEWETFFFFFKSIKIQNTLAFFIDLLINDALWC